MEVNWGVVGNNDSDEKRVRVGRKKLVLATLYHVTIEKTKLG